MGRKLVIVKHFKGQKPEKPKKIWQVEAAKSNRSTCMKCKQQIEKGVVRIGVVTFYPHRYCRWYHLQCSGAALLGATEERIWGKSKLEESEVTKIMTMVEKVNMVTVIKQLPGLTGQLDMPRFAAAMTGRYNKFRAFRFGLPEEQRYTKNWNWRCFLATMLVCNTHETAMLAVTDKLFTVYQTPEALAALEGDKTTQKAWMDWMEKNDMRHAGKKISYIIRANKNLLENYDGEVPDNRDALQAMNGVGRHVASVTMAWVHEKAEFGIDTHVRRIMERWGYINKGDTEVEVENKVKKIIPEKQIGHFSRAFVDHGQQICGYTPDCENCFMKHSCPTASKLLDW